MNTTDNHHTTCSSKEEGGGVADYFAILGVGEELTWKHAQKKSTEAATPSSNNHETNDQDEAALVQRFYREIVQVNILVIQPQEQQQQQQRPRVIGQAPSYTEEHDLKSTRSFSSSALPHSPSHSDATTNVTFADATNDNNTSIQQVEMDGFTIIQRTCPAGRSFSQTDAASLGGVLSQDSLLSGKTDSSLQAELWTKNQTFPADLNPAHGLRQTFRKIPSAIMTGGGRHTPLKGLQRKLGTSLRKLNTSVHDVVLGKHVPNTNEPEFVLGFQRRGADDLEKPAVADVVLRYVKIYRKTICTNDEETLTTMISTNSHRAAALRRTLATGANNLAAFATKRHDKHEAILNAASFETTKTYNADATIVPLEEFIPLPRGFDEWSIPQEYKLLKFTSLTPQPSPEQVMDGGQHKTILINHSTLKGSDRDGNSETSSGMGVEAYMESGSIQTPPQAKRKTNEWGETTGFQSSTPTSTSVDPDVYLPKLLPEHFPDDLQNDANYIYIPILAIRRQGTSDEERYHEDPGVVDIAITFCDSGGNTVMPEEEDDEEDEGGFCLTDKSKWTRASFSKTIQSERSRPRPAQPLGTPIILVKRNVPIGFADVAFATSVLDRFPLKNYKDLPLPEEELPMFCYPTGCRLFRARYSDAPLPQYYGFVVKNERGDSIHGKCFLFLILYFVDYCTRFASNETYCSRLVSCVSFMEPLTVAKIEQLNLISERRRRVSLAHRCYCERRHLMLPRVGGPGSNVSDLPIYDGASQTKRSQNGSGNGIDSPQSEASWRDDDSFLTGFSDMTTFENKTICLISRYPFWTAFRRFLSHLHVLSGSLSDLPLERCISHLLLSVPVPKPGGPCVIVPLPALNGPMVLSMPPEKDFPLVDLPYARLLACLDVPTIITIVLGFLALERKVRVYLLSFANMIIRCY